MPRRSRRWIWAGRVAFGVATATLVAYLAAVGLDRADKVASSIAVILALVALGAPHLFPQQQGDRPTSSEDGVEDTGSAVATGGGQANTGLQTGRDARPAHVTRSGNATATGPGSTANTGIQRQPWP